MAMTTFFIVVMLVYEPRCCVDSYASHKGNVTVAAPPSRGTLQQHIVDRMIHAQGYVAIRIHYHDMG